MARIYRLGPGQIYTAFGADYGLRVIQELTGQNIQPSLGGGKNLRWGNINMSYGMLSDLAKTISKDAKNFSGVEGMIRLAKIHKTNLGHLYTAFGGDRGVKVVQELTGEDIRGALDGEADLDWESISMPYELLEELAHQIVTAPENYAGIEGMIRLAKIHKTNLRNLYTAFGGDRAVKVVRELTGSDIHGSLSGGDGLGWVSIALPYELLEDLANRIARAPESYMDVEGMIRLAGIYRTHLEFLHSAFGSQRGVKVVEELTGSNILPSLKGASDLGWESINMPYSILEDLGSRIANAPGSYVGIEGMVELASFYRSNFGHIYSAFGGSRGVKVIQELTGTDIRTSRIGEDGLGWERINLPYDILEELANAIANEPRKYAGIEGMVRLANIHKTNFDHIYSSFGKDRGPKVIQKLTGRSIDGPLDWKSINAPFAGGVQLLKDRNLISEEFLQTLSPGAWAVVWKWMGLKVPQSPWGVAGLFAGFGVVEGLITGGIGVGAREWIGPLGLSLGFPILVPVVAALGVWVLINLFMHAKGLFAWNAEKQEWEIISPRETRGPPNPFFSAIAIAALSLFGLYLAVDPTSLMMTSLIWAVAPHAFFGFMIPFLRLHKTMNRVAMSAHVLALMVKAEQTPEVSAQEAKTLLKGLLREDGEFMGGGLSHMGSLQAEPDMQDVAAYMNAKLFSPNPFMRFFAKRLLLRELAAVGVPVNAQLLDKFLRTMDAGSGSHLKDAFQNREVILFVPPSTSWKDLQAVSLLTRVFNVHRLAVVVEEGQVADVTGVVNQALSGAPRATVVPVPKDSFQKENEFFNLKLSERSWSRLAADLPPQGHAMAFGDVRLVGPPAGTIFDRFVREGINNLFKILPEASMRIGTILNLEGIVAALAAA